MLNTKSITLALLKSSIVSLKEPKHKKIAKDFYAQDFSFKFNVNSGVLSFV